MRITDRDWALAGVKVKKHIGSDTGTYRYNKREYTLSDLAVKTGLSFERLHHEIVERGKDVSRAVALIRLSERRKNERAVKRKMAST